jgi:hypothetical protein
MESPAILGQDPMTRKTGWPVRVKLPTLPPEWQAGDAVREARPVRTIDLSDPNGLGIRPLSRPSAAVRAGVRRGLARCPASDAEHLASAQQVQDPASAGCGFSSVTLPFRVLTSLAAIASVVTEAESA